MPRTARAAEGGLCYHVLNRGNGRAQVFFKDGDYEAFFKAMGDAYHQVGVPILAYCLMPNHFHAVLWPTHAEDFGRFLHGWLNAHVRRYHQHYHSSGHVWQERSKAFCIQEDSHLLTVLRYVERNPVRAGLGKRAEQWPWSSARFRGVASPPPVYLHDGPVPRPSPWLDDVSQALTVAERNALRTCVQRGRPYGNAPWVEKTANRLGLASTLRPRGRPRRLAGDPADEKR